LDKVALDQRYDPLAPLHSLLEVETAQRFEDQSLPGIAIDASHVRWLCCANDLAPIPKPLLSRLHVVQVEPPTKAEVYRVFEQVFADVVDNSLLKDFDQEISKSILDHAAGTMSVREFKTRAGMAVGRALVEGRRCVQGADFEGSKTLPSLKMGF
jgi:ATP-dependent Lon protease